jgi:ribosomal protein S18 acetylase RimI-like enzyme/O-methyltransferase involved in polyketide biosynthesis
VEATNEILPPERALRLVFVLLFLDCWPAGRPDYQSLSHHRWQIHCQTPKGLFDAAIHTVLCEALSPVAACRPPTLMTSSSPSSSLNHASPVAKTAFDSIQAKKSALSAGYDTMVVENTQRYHELLERITSGLTTKRQTPLINAGYACRVLAMSHSVSQFVKYHQHTCPHKRIQIVLLGCGIDILGLWSRSLVPHGDVLRIVELDMPTVCSTKKRVLDQCNLVAFRDSSDYAGASSGTIESEIGTSLSDPDYILCPVDLRITTQLDTLVRDGIFLDPSIVPTLVITELVLSYLNAIETDHLLKWSSSNLIRTDGSAMLALEPLGVDDSTTTSGNTKSVWEGYRRDYCQRFHTKMERGIAPNAQIAAATVFHPIGPSAEAVVKRFQTAGYGRVHANELGFFAAHVAAASSLFQLPENFDEHAALVMHLRSYLVITAFSSDGCDGAIERLLCPASYAPFEIPPLLAHEGIVCRTIEPSDEGAVREIFGNSYADLAETHPAVRRMVKGVLNREFAVTSGGGVPSDIAARYTQKGGCFLVAVSYSHHGTPRRSVVGCVGIRSCEHKEAVDAMEIFRLAVDEKYRGQGIGRQLLHAAESFARSRNVVKVVASTITNLESAMLLYEACGYQLEGDSPLGTLTMRTYSKCYGRSQ